MTRRLEQDPKPAKVMKMDVAVEKEKTVVEKVVEKVVVKKAVVVDMGMDHDMEDSVLEKLLVEMEELNKTKQNKEQ